MEVPAFVGRGRQASGEQEFFVLAQAANVLNLLEHGLHFFLHRAQNISPWRIRKQVSSRWWASSALTPVQIHRNDAEQGAFAPYKIFS